MTPKTQEFVKYGLIIIIMAVILGSCKKNSDPVVKQTPPKTGTVDTTPGVETPAPQIPLTEKPVVTPEITKVESNKVAGIIKIANAAKGMESALTQYYGKAAPNMKLKDINGEQFSISGLKGKKTVIIKWSTTNEPSTQMIRSLIELQSQVGKTNLSVVAISTEDSAILKPVVKSMDIHFPVAGRRNRLIDPYRSIREPPVCFFIDKAGKIQLITKSVLPPDVLNSLVEAL